MRLRDDGWTLDLMSGRKSLALKHRRAPPFAAGEETRTTRGGGKLASPDLVRSFLESCTTAHGLDRNGLKHPCFAAIYKPEPRFVRAFESRSHFLRAGERRLLRLLPPRPWPRRARERTSIDDQRRIGPRVTNMGADVQRDPVSRNALPRDFIDHGPRQLARRAHQYLASLVA